MGIDNQAPVCDVSYKPQAPTRDPAEPGLGHILLKYMLSPYLSYSEINILLFTCDGRWQEERRERGGQGGIHLAITIVREALVVLDMPFHRWVNIKSAHIEFRDLSSFSSTPIKSSFTSFTSNFSSHFTSQKDNSIHTSHSTTQVYRDHRWLG